LRSYPVIPSGVHAFPGEQLYQAQPIGENQSQANFALAKCTLPASCVRFEVALFGFLAGRR
jgi:hypothetical protein